MSHDEEIPIRSRNGMTADRLDPHPIADRVVDRILVGQPGYDQPHLVPLVGRPRRGAIRGRGDLPAALVRVPGDDLVVAIAAGYGHGGPERTVGPGGHGPRPEIHLAVVVAVDRRRGLGDEVVGSPDLLSRRDLLRDGQRDPGSRARVAGRIDLPVARLDGSQRVEVDVMDVARHGQSRAAQPGLDIEQRGGAEGGHPGLAVGLRLLGEGRRRVDRPPRPLPIVVIGEGDGHGLRGDPIEPGPRRGSVAPAAVLVCPVVRFAADPQVHAGHRRALEERGGCRHADLGSRQHGVLVGHQAELPRRLDDGSDAHVRGSKHLAVGAKHDVVVPDRDVLERERGREHAGCRLASGELPRSGRPILTSHPRIGARPRADPGANRRHANAPCPRRWRGPWSAGSRGPSRGRATTYRRPSHRRPRSRCRTFRRRIRR